MHCLEVYNFSGLCLEELIISSITIFSDTRLRVHPKESVELIDIISLEIFVESA